MSPYTASTAPPCFGRLSSLGRHLSSPSYNTSSPSSHYNLLINMMCDAICYFLMIYCVSMSTLTCSWPWWNSLLCWLHKRLLLPVFHISCHGFWRIYAQIFLDNPNQWKLIWNRGSIFYDSLMYSCMSPHICWCNSYGHHYCMWLGGGRAGVIKTWAWVFLACMFNRDKLNRWT
jgi:hypothetical protein